MLICSLLMLCRGQLLGSGMSMQNIRELYASRQPLAWESNLANLDAIPDLRTRSLVASLLRCVCLHVCICLVVCVHVRLCRCFSTKAAPGRPASIDPVRQL